MIIRGIKNIILSGSLMFLSAFVLGQEAPFKVVSDIGKKSFFPGDTVSFTIKNRSSKSRGYTIEAICMDANGKSKNYYGELYTAYFNKDTSFFRKLKESKEVSKKRNIGFMMPDVELIPYTINADSLSTFLYIVKGNRMSSGIKIKFRITPDLVDNEPDFSIETKSFLIFSKAF